MPNTRARCSVCRDYFDRDEMYRTMALSRVCSEECWITLLDRKKVPKPTKKSAPRKRKPGIELSVRREVRCRDAGLCRFCGKRGEQVHHVVFRSHGGSDHPSNLITLCAACHASHAHGAHSRYYRSIFLAYIWIVMVEKRLLMVADVEERLGWTQLFKRRVISEQGCWVWTGAVTRKTLGYGVMKPYGGEGVKVLVHRVAYENTYGVIPGGKLVLHHCDNSLCFNPEHLFLGTQQDNVDDMHRKGRARKALGADSPNSKLDLVAISEIRERRAKGATCAELAKEYGCNESNISHICLGRTWKHAM